MFGPVRAVGEALGASGELTQVGSLTSVAPLVDLQVLQTGKRFITAVELEKKKLLVA